MPSGTHSTFNTHLGNMTLVDRFREILSSIKEELPYESNRDGYIPHFPIDKSNLLRIRGAHQLLRAGMADSALYILWSTLQFSSDFQTHNTVMAQAGAVGEVEGTRIADQLGEEFPFFQKLSSSEHNH